MAAYKTLGSKLQVSIAGTFTDLTGVQNFDVDPGENSTFETGDLTTDYDTLMATGVGGGGTISGSKLHDPLDPVDQFLQARFNAGGAGVTTDGIEGKAELGATGVIYDWEAILTKWTPKVEKKNGGMVDFELKHVDRMLLNEVDPA